ncbi:anaerobic sulfite reductase subunit B [Candidatus Woesearchaeota archaeon]|jgi:anaerobic sulfite reductase subunit B|nr:anaerobic sulfite reductase subunit B [Candidatus Woesearchaeota archaeon]|tara:strand:+ start:906 stop:1700 length:795 start_codon:yes stop_codon:yes gene_type:complete
MKSIYQAKRYKIKDIQRQSNNNIMLRIKTKINPSPGQFVEVSIPGIGESPISTASYNKKILDLNVQVVGNVTEALAKMRIGQKIHLRGPYGTSYPLEQLKGENLILVAGGCGVAPLRAVIEYLKERRLDYKEIHLFFGFRSPKDILFKEEMKEWKSLYHLNLSVDKAPEENPFNCPVGFVTQILEEADISADNSSILLCGPPVMMDKSITILENKGFSTDKMWISLERHMKCSTGKCGHCMVNGKYLCIDGPVFRYDKVKGIDE